MSDKKDKDIKNFIINYEDGTSKTVEKGFFCEMRENEDGSGNLIFNMVDVQGKGSSETGQKNLWLSFVNTSAGYFTEIICFPRVPAMLRKKRQRNGI